MPDLDVVLDALERHRQRATYGAVGAVVDRPASFLMGGRPRVFRHSWVVNKETQRPTGYEPHECHPALFAHERVIASGAELESWLAEHP